MEPEGFVYLALATSGASRVERGYISSGPGEVFHGKRGRESLTGVGGGERGNSLGNNLSSIHRKDRNQVPRRRSKISSIR
jgi:hypothetical protein